MRFSDGGESELAIDIKKYAETTQQVEVETAKIAEEVKAVKKEPACASEQPAKPSAGGPDHSDDAPMPAPSQTVEVPGKVKKEILSPASKPEIPQPCRPGFPEPSEAASAGLHIPNANETPESPHEAGATSSTGGALVPLAL